MKAKKKKWHWVGVAEWDWRLFGLGVEFSFGYWVPREWSVYLTLGPILLGFGREGSFDA